MNITSISPENLEFVCEGCLTTDRQLTSEVTDVVMKKLFYEVLNVRENIDTLTLRLCVECKANMMRFMVFRQQVVDAHHTLQLYLLKSSHSINIISKYIKRGDDGDDFKAHDDDGTIRNGDEGHAPLAFVKIEGTDDIYDDDDDFYFADDKHFKTVLTKDLIAPPNKLSLSTRVKTTDEQFDASDDEPLTKLSTKHSRKRNNTHKENHAPGQTAGGRREKPAGVVDNARVRSKLQRLGASGQHLQMVVLSWHEVEQERQKALNSDTFTRHQFRCDDCALGFNHRFKLDNHMKKHQPSAGDLVCSVCKVRCKHAHALCAHRRRHRVRWRCVVCGALMSRACVAADHAAREHGAAPPAHLCRRCGHTETSLGRLRRHMREHAERQLCPLCHKTFRDRAALRTHLFIHSGEKEHACPRCDKRFLFKKAMQVHLVTHDAHAHLYCHQCDLSFKNSMSYKQHMKYSLKHVDPADLKHACASCGKRFLKAARLRDHTLAVHLKQTPVSCHVPACTFACSSRAVLRTHVRVQHRGARAARNHVCHTCGKTYLTKKSLEGHLRAHAGERPFACALCPSAFGYHAALYNHTRLVHQRKSRAAPAPPADTHTDTQPV